MGLISDGEAYEKIMIFGGIQNVILPKQPLREQQTDEDLTQTSNV